MVSSEDEVCVSNGPLARKSDTISDTIDDVHQSLWLIPVTLY